MNHVEEDQDLNTAVMGLLFLIIFVIGTDTFLISPLLPVLQTTFHVNAGAAGWMVSAYALGYALFALLAGPLSDRLNRKKVMIMGLVCFSLSTGLCAAAFDFWSMNLFRFAAGVSAAFVTPQVWASIPLLVPKDKILKGMGIATAGLSISQLLGLPIGSYLASVNWRVPFVALALIALFLGIAAHAVLPGLLPHTKDAQAREDRSLIRTYTYLLRSTTAVLAFGAYFIFQFGNFAAFSFLGSWLSVSYHLGVSDIGGVMLFLGLGNTIGSLGGATIVQRIGVKRTLLIGITISGFIYLLLANSPYLWMVKAGLFVIFMISGTLFPLMISCLQSLSSTARGTIAALSNALMYLGTSLGAAAAGGLYQATGTFLSVTMLTFISFILFLILFNSSGILKPQVPVKA